MSCSRSKTAQIGILGNSILSFLYDQSINLGEGKALFVDAGCRKMLGIALKASIIFALFFFSPRAGRGFKRKRLSFAAIVTCGKFQTADSAPAEIGLMEIPSKVKLRAQRIFSVSEVELFWNKNGDRLAAHTERYQKKNVKSTGGIEDVKYSVRIFIHFHRRNLIVRPIYCHL